MIKKKLFTFFSLVSLLTVAQNTSVSVNVNVKHTVGDVDEFDRSKYIVLHASLTEGDWNGEMDKMDYVLGDLDVYLGRDNGSMGWHMNQAMEDPSKSGYADPNGMVSAGKRNREVVYGTNLAERHKYEDKADVLFGGQESPFWPGHSTNPCCSGTPWVIGGANASGDFMGQYFNEFFRKDGETSVNGLPQPRYMEVINEPLYGLVDTGTHTPLDVFQYHNDVADAIRVHNSDILIGGYTTAFPVFEEDNFQRWEDRMKLFIDTSADKMDFYSIHLYDFNKHHLSDGNPSTFDGPWYFKGSRIEATMDMIEQYSMLKSNSIKPFLISEYGGRDHSTEWKDWTPERDWQFMKSFTPMMMQFMERPNVILKTVPFVLNKATWGTTDVVYPWRLMRQQKEASGETGDNWVFTEIIKFYELWSDVKGTRVEIKSENLDIMTDAYVDGKKAYVILNNLDFTSELINLNIFGNKNNQIESIKVKHLYLSGSAPVLDEQVITGGANTDFTLEPEASAILEYNFLDPIVIDETEDEVKYYADTYKKPITANTPESFKLDGVALTSYNEATLRVGFGRDHGKSKAPKVVFNGTELDVSENYRGDDQALRPQYFILLEIPVPSDLIQENNTVTVEFADDGGHVSTVTMQVYNFSSNIRKLDPEDIPANNYKLQVTDASCTNSNNGIINIETLNPQNYNASITGTGYNKSFSFTNDLEVKDLSPGEYKVLITISDISNYQLEFNITIDKPEDLSVSSKVNNSKDLVVLNLEGSDSYIINLNGSEIKTSSKEITLELQNGVNRLSVSTNKSCQGTYEDMIFVDKSIKIFPNPIQDNLNIHASEKLINSTAYIYNIVGELVQTKTITQQNDKISTGNLKQVLYVIIFRKNDKEQLAYEKFIKR